MPLTKKCLFYMVQRWRIRYRLWRLGRVSKAKLVWKGLKGFYLILLVVATVVSVPSAYFLYSLYMDRGVQALQLTCVRENPKNETLPYFLNDYTLVVGFHSPLPWSIHATWLIIVRVADTFFGSNSTRNELWTFPGFSNVTLKNGNNQVPMLDFNTSRFGLSAFRSIIARSVTLVEDYSGPLYYSFHRDFTNSDGFNLTSIRNRALDPLDFDKNVVTAFLFRYLASSANINTNSYTICPQNP
jgi:hypothetical protein